MADSAQVGLTLNAKVKRQQICAGHSRARGLRYEERNRIAPPTPPIPSYPARQLRQTRRSCRPCAPGAAAWIAPDVKPPQLMLKSPQRAIRNFNRVSFA